MITFKKICFSPKDVTKVQILQKKNERLQRLGFVFSTLQLLFLQPFKFILWPFGWYISLILLYFCWCRTLNTVFYITVCIGTIISKIRSEYFYHRRSQNPHQEQSITRQITDCLLVIWGHKIHTQLTITHVENITTRWQQLTNHLCNCLLIFCYYFPVKTLKESSPPSSISINHPYLFLQAAISESEASYLISKTSALLSSYFLFHSLTSISLVMIWLEDKTWGKKK